MAREYFCAYHSLLDGLQILTDAEVGRLFRGALSYSATGCEPTLPGREGIVWPMIKGQIDRDTSKYSDFCTKQSKNIKKRWDTTVYDGKSGIPSDTKDTNKKEKKKTKEKTKENNIPPISPKGDWGDVSPELKAALDEFAEMRKKIKKPLTDRAKQLTIRDLDKLAQDDGTKIAILEQSVLHCWQGVFPLKNDDIGTDTKNPYTKLLNEMQNGGDPF